MPKFCIILRHLRVLCLNVLKGIFEVIIRYVILRIKYAVMRGLVNDALTFINGKMDLVQAEAVAALVYSKSEESARVQQKIISGDLSLILNRVRLELILELSSLEYQMDISDEDISVVFCRCEDKRIQVDRNAAESMLYRGFQGGINSHLKSCDVRMCD